MAYDNHAVVNPQTQIANLTIKTAESTDTRRYFTITLKTGETQDWEVRVGKYQTITGTDDMLRKMGTTTRPLADMGAQGEAMSTVLAGYRTLKGLTVEQKAQLSSIAEAVDNYKRKIVDACRVRHQHNLTQEERREDKRVYLHDAAEYGRKVVRRLSRLIQALRQNGDGLSWDQADSDMTSLDRSQTVIVVWEKAFQEDIFR